MMAADETIEWKAFLETVPPHTPKLVTNALEEFSGGFDSLIPVRIALDLHCETCGGIRRFHSEKPDAHTVFLAAEPIKTFTIEHLCLNCMTEKKAFAIHIDATATLESELAPRATKIGELPRYGPPTPARVVTLIREDRDLFTKGYRCEAQGLGIAAHAYYRRVVERQRTKLIGKIIEVAKRTEDSSVDIETLERAKAETQFSKSLEMIKDVKII